MKKKSYSLSQNRAPQCHWLAFAAVILSLTISRACAAGVAEIYGFTGTYATTLIQGADGNFYGTTPVGGAYNLGTVFEWNPAEGFTNLVEFNGTNGSSPNGLTQTPDGSFYGTTFYGGTSPFVNAVNKGTAFEIDPTGVYFGTLFSFPRPFGTTSTVNPYSSLVVGPDGNLYGLCSDFPLISIGNVFRLTPVGVPSEVADLGNLNNSSANPPLTVDIDGNLYFTAGAIYPNSFGTLTRVPASGHAAAFYIFTDPLLGAYPQGGLLPAADGSLYGVTLGGGANGYGTLYNVTTNGTLSSLVSFDWANGAGPRGGLTFGSDGNLYGTTTLGGADGVGTVFMLSTNDAFATLGTFNGANGAYPLSTLISASDGKLYGTTSTGGTNGTGTIFQVTPGGAPATTASLPGFNGATPWGGLITGTDGNFYGTTYAGGTYEYGTVFKVTPAGLVTMLYSFGASEDTNGLAFDGGGPQGELLQDADGSLYGTTSRGGTYDAGTIFQLTTGGALKTLFSFDGPNGSNPQAGLTTGTDGNFYGTTSGGGDYGNGTVFKFAPNGGLTTLFSFTNSGSGSVLYANGFRPYAGLTRGRDGNFYGVTASTAFKITPDGVLTNLAVFNGSNGATPVAALALGTDGNLYGSTAGGGTANAGTVFQLTTNGTLTTLLSFQRTNGSTPCGRLIQAADGNFYGTTRGGAISNCGTVFRLTTPGALTTLATFNYTNGANPVGGLTLGTDGNLYGMTLMGGSGTGGNLFQIALPPTLRVTSGTGATLTLTWNAIPGQSYQLQSSPTLAPPNWTDLGSPLTATTSVLTTFDTIGAGQQFYRIELLP